MCSCIALQYNNKSSVYILTYVFIFRLGTYFCPFLSLIMIIKLFIIFYVKRVSNSIIFFVKELDF